jgi:hypothetical protein
MQSGGVVPLCIEKASKRAIALAGKAALFAEIAFIFFFL